MSKKKVNLPAMDIGIDEKHREQIAKGLSALLADSYTLYLMTHNFHWNVTGPQFNSLHLMFMGQYTEQWNALDIIAERLSLIHICTSTPVSVLGSSRVANWLSTRVVEKKCALPRAPTRA